VLNVDNKIEDLQEELEDAAALAQRPPTAKNDGESDTETDTQGMDETFMSESIYEKLPSPSRQKRPHKTISTLEHW
jgi:division protein 1